MHARAPSTQHHQHLPPLHPTDAIAGVTITCATDAGGCEEGRHTGVRREADEGQTRTEICQTRADQTIATRHARATQQTPPRAPIRTMVVDGVSACTKAMGMRHVVWRSRSGWQGGRQAGATLLRPATSTPVKETPSIKGKKECTKHVDITYNTLPSVFFHSPSGRARQASQRLVALLVCRARTNRAQCHPTREHPRTRPPRVRTTGARREKTSKAYGCGVHDRSESSSMTDLSTLSYKELQQLAKQHGISAKQKVSSHEASKLQDTKRV